MIGEPLGICADNRDNIYFGEAYNQRVRKVGYERNYHYP